MQFTATILAFAAAVAAAPSQCTFGQYVCSKDGLSILQCDITGNLVTIGPCPDGSKCSNIGDIPYCQAVPKTKRSAPYCATPGAYTCTPDLKGINVCNAQNQLVFNGACPDKTHCGYLNGIPFCVDNAIKGY
ncbi:hypothetical protein N8I77_005784 [Diaporthe amygdali]|uniref:Uncharacterized protein n=1 Tax=Phomopsis amygdali TaxID=1214568 RepID=A0AAD9SGR1_PHOAM|nr:uncharacterized protein J7T55_006137 [Diaporthe amygdali]KAJ0124796.1 hypothetical protein J7T55_006137 [Diaporthe amygdali]KAK2607078.1 hypothetical protein N8I77_005784 [Diaporthe amygdali]